MVLLWQNIKCNISLLFWNCDALNKLHANKALDSSSCIPAFYSEMRLFCNCKIFRLTSGCIDHPHSGARGEGPPHPDSRNWRGQHRPAEGHATDYEDRGHSGQYPGLRRQRQGDEGSVAESDIDVLLDTSCSEHRIYCLRTRLLCDCHACVLRGS